VTFKHCCTGKCSYGIHVKDWNHLYNWR